MDEVSDAVQGKDPNFDVGTIILGAAAVTGVGLALGAVGIGSVTMATAGSTFLANVALGTVAQALAPKPPGPEFRDNLITARTPVANRSIIYGKTRVSGNIVYIESTGDDNKYLHLVIAYADHEINGFKEVYFDNELVWTDASGYQSDWASYARINRLNGNQTTADADLVSESSHWTSAHVLNGIAYLYVRLTFSSDKFQSVPNITSVIEGKKVFDPRTETTAYSNNPALCILDYMQSSRHGLNIQDDEINEDSFIAAANLCDEDVTLANSETQKRYTLDGSITTGNTPKQNLELMLTSCAGFITYSGGMFYLFGAEYRAPTFDLDESSIVGAMQIQTRTSRRNLFNGVKGVFASEDDNYVLSEYPAVTSSQFASDDGDDIILDVSLPFTTNAIRAERIAKLSLLRTRQQISVVISCNLSAIRMKAGDTVRLSNTRMGWNQKVFEVVDMSFSAMASGELGVAMNLLETSSAVYDWTTDDEMEYVAGQDTTLADPFSVNAPTSVTLTQGSVVQSDGTTRPTLNATWTNNDAFADQFEVKFGIVGGNDQTLITRNTFFEIPNVDTGEEYQIQVRAINRLGSTSAYAPVLPVTEDGGTGIISGAKIINESVPVGKTEPGTSFDFSTNGGGLPEYKYFVGPSGTGTGFENSDYAIGGKAYLDNRGGVVAYSEKAVGLGAFTEYDGLAGTWGAIIARGGYNYDDALARSQAVIGSPNISGRFTVGIRIERSVTGATKASPCVITVSTAHTLVDDDTVLIQNVSGMTQLNNNVYRIAVLSSTTFALYNATTGAPINSTGFGTYTGNGDIYTARPEYITDSASIGADTYLAFVAGSGVAYSVYSAKGTTGPFTGSHDAVIRKSELFDVGDIVVDVDVIAAPSVSDSITLIEKSSMANQRGTIGVFCGETGFQFAPAAMSYYEQQKTIRNVPKSSIRRLLPEYEYLLDDHSFAMVNALGEGKINVCGENGSIGIGDLIVSSSMPGKGMRQDDDIIRSYTVAKSRENVSFDSPDEVKQIACIYLGG